MPFSRESNDETIVDPSLIKPPKAPKTRKSFSFSVSGGLLPAALIVLLGAAAYYGYSSTHRIPAETTPYQAVLLSNGSAYFGRLEGLGTPFPVLTDVFYVQSVKNPQTNEVSNILVKRGKEWHAPDRMLINANDIVLIEPVNPSSRVAQLIAAAK
jgi:hypothetical protein